MAERGNWGLIEIPDHMGVINVGGRVGAAGGPRAFRDAFFRLKGLWPARQNLTVHVQVDSLTFDVAANHRKAADAISIAHKQTGCTVVVGGGHDHGFSHLLGIAQAIGSTHPRLGCINIDAHLDVRPPLDGGKRITSGSPFFLALESGILEGKRFVEFGIQTHCNAAEQLEYVRTKGAHVQMMSTLRKGTAVTAFHKTLKRVAALSEAVVISLDLDALSEAHAPGVSAPQAEGFSSSEIMEMVELAARNPKVVSLGIFELNPEHDVGGRTARLAAQTAYHFLEARAQAGEIKPRAPWVRVPVARKRSSR
jgi:formiminoglutamase